MKVVVAGATGLIGRHLCAALLLEGHAVTALVRNVARAAGSLPPGVEAVTWTPRIERSWSDALAECDAVVNLSGASIGGQRWTPAYKDLLRSSRIDTTRALVAALREAPQRPRVLLSASAVGYYGDRGDELLDESAQQGTGFLADLCRDWEAEALRAREAGVRVVQVRSGHILAGDGGMLSRLRPVFGAFIGGPIGSGRQWVSSIHVADWARLAHALLNDTQFHGPVNACSPNPVRMREFAKQLGAAMRRPALLPVPGPLLRLVVGELADSLLGGQRVLPTRVERAGFTWRWPAVGDALRDLLG